MLLVNLTALKFLARSFVIDFKLWGEKSSWERLKIATWVHFMKLLWALCEISDAQLAFLVWLRAHKFYNPSKATLRGFGAETYPPFGGKQANKAAYDVSTIRAELIGAGMFSWWLVPGTTAPPTDRQSFYRASRFWVNPRGRFTGGKGESEWANKTTSSSPFDVIRSDFSRSAFFGCENGFFT